jgi:hypothetical protein
MLFANPRPRSTEARIALTKAGDPDGLMSSSRRTTMGISAGREALYPTSASRPCLAAQWQACHAAED